MSDFFRSTADPWGTLGTSLGDTEGDVLTTGPVGTDPNSDPNWLASTQNPASALADQIRDWLMSSFGLRSDRANSVVDIVIFGFIGVALLTLWSFVKKGRL